jgi:hypothetical protein
MGRTAGGSKTFRRSTRVRQHLSVWPPCVASFLSCWGAKRFDNALLYRTADRIGPSPCREPPGQPVRELEFRALILQRETASKLPRTVSRQAGSHAIRALISDQAAHRTKRKFVVTSGVPRSVRAGHADRHDRTTGIAHPVGGLHNGVFKRELRDELPASRSF